MKKLSSLVFAVLFSASLFAQEKKQEVKKIEVPESVKKSFTQNFPNAKDIEWKMEGLIYDVEFEIGDIDHEAWMDSSGAVIKHKYEIREADLPNAVVTTLKDKYPSAKIEDTWKMEEGGSSTYKVKIKDNGTEWKLTFTPDGKLIDKKTVEK